MKNKSLDSVFTVCEEHWSPYWTENCHPIDWKISERPRRQDVEKRYRENGMMYISKSKIVIENELRYGGRMGMLPVKTSLSLDINTSEDLVIAEKLL